GPSTYGAIQDVPSYKIICPLSKNFWKRLPTSPQFPTRCPCKTREMSSETIIPSGRAESGEVAGIGRQIGLVSSLYSGYRLAAGLKFLRTELGKIFPSFLKILVTHEARGPVGDRTKEASGATFVQFAE